MDRGMTRLAASKIADEHRWADDLRRLPSVSTTVETPTEPRLPAIEILRGAVHRLIGRTTVA